MDTANLIENAVKKGLLELRVSKGASPRLPWTVMTRWRQSSQWAEHRGSTCHEAVIAALELANSAP